MKKMQSAGFLIRICLWQTRTWAEEDLEIFFLKDESWERYFLWSKNRRVHRDSQGLRQEDPCSRTFPKGFFGLCTKRRKNDLFSSKGSLYEDETSKECERKLKKLKKVLTNVHRIKRFRICSLLRISCGDYLCKDRRFWGLDSWGGRKSGSFRSFEKKLGENLKL